MSKLILCGLGMMFSLYGYNHLTHGQLELSQQSTPEKVEKVAELSFTERISSARRSQP